MKPIRQMAFRFSKDPDQQTVDHLQKTSQLDATQLTALTHIILNFLSSSNGEQLISSLQSYSQDYSTSLAVLKQMSRALIMLFKGAFQNNLNAAQLTEDLSQLGFSTEQVNIIQQQWKKAFASLSHSSLGKTLMVNQLLLPEWKFGITASNKDLKDVGSTFMQLKLILDRGDGQKQYEYVEMTLAQFYQFFATMEKAKAQLDFFS